MAAESEIDLRGMDTMEAVAATERFLDNAVMAKLEKVTIIHGKGTGALRAAVQQSLRKTRPSSPTGLAVTARARAA